MIVSAPADWNETRTGDIRWRVRPEMHDALLGTGGLPLDEWLRQGRAVVVKRGSQRVVYRVELDDGQAVFIKHHFHGSLRGRLRQAVRASKARTEFGRALAAAARGVPTVEPLALGERQTALGGTESFLVTRSLDDTQTLNRFIATTLVEMSAVRLGLVRQRLAKALGKFVARLHDGGIRHGDLHAANILLELTGDDRPKLYLIDLDAVRLGAPLDWPASRDNLVLLARWFVPRASWSDRMRFWRAYYEGRGLGVWPRGCRGHREHFALAREVEEQAHASMLAFWKKRDRRCLKTNRYFRRISRPGLEGHAVADLDPQLLASLLTDPDAPFGEQGVRLLKDSRSSTVAEIGASPRANLSPEGESQGLIYKRFRVRGWTDLWAGLVRASHARRSWQYGQGLCTRCLPTARPLLLLQRYRAGLPKEAYLLTEKIENAVDLHRFAAGLDDLAPALARQRVRLAIDSVARTVRRLHDCRLSHRDLKATNCLISLNVGSPSPPFLASAAFAPAASLPSYLPLPSSPVWFIDLAGVRLYARLSRGRRVQNLARLHVSFHQSRVVTRTDKLRFLRAYLLWNLVGRGDWKSWWRAIDRATTWKVAGNRRRGRVLA